MKKKIFEVKLYPWKTTVSIKFEFSKKKAASL